MSFCLDKTYFCGGLLLEITWLVFLRPSSVSIKAGQNCAACSLACAPPSVHISRMVSQLRWLQPKPEFPGNACHCLNAITSPTPAHLPDLLHLYSPSRSLHSSTNTRLLQPPLCRCKVKGGRALLHSDQSVWNTLPVHVGNVTTTDTSSQQSDRILQPRTF